MLQALERVAGSVSGVHIAAVVALALLVTSCSSGTQADAEPTSGQPTPGPELVSEATAEVSVSSVPANTLTAAVEVTATAPVTASVEFRGDVSGEVSSAETPQDRHRIPVVGMHPMSTYELVVTVTDEQGLPVSTEGAVQTFETGALPEGLPGFEVEVIDPSRVAPGHTMFSFLDFAGQSGTSEDPGAQLGTIMVVDASGEPVWYFQDDETLADARQLDNGNFLFEVGDVAAYEVNLFGEVVKEWAGALAGGSDRVGDSDQAEGVGDNARPAAVQVDVESMHHEHGVLSNGNHLGLSTELRTVSGFAEPLCGEDPATFDGTYHLIGDVVYEFDPTTGEVLEEFNLFDYFDPTVSINPDSICDGPAWVFPNNVYRQLDPEAQDWTHANSVVLDEERNALIVSIRLLDEVLAIRYADDDDGPKGEVLWRLGEHGDLEMLGDGSWTYHQHAAEVWPDGSLLIYDNGNGRPSTESSPPGSRVVRYELDDDDMTIRQLWELDSIVDGEVAYAGFVGDADLLGNGNVLISDGGLLGEPNGVSAQITEVVPELPEGGEVVWQLQILGGGNWGSYRAERISELYPT